MWLSFPIVRHRQRYKLRSRSRSRRSRSSRSRSHSRSCPRSRARLRSRSRSKSKRLRAECKEVKWSLAPRNASEMSICWKYSIMFIMVIVTALHMMNTYSFKSIQLSHIYGNVCFLSEKVLRPDTVCDYLLISPMCLAIVSMIWVQMFYICGRGGYTFRNQHIDEQPWRIVLPSVVCFALVTIFQFIYVTVLYVHMTSYCDVLRTEYPEHRAKNCEYLVGVTSKEPITLHYRMLYCSAMLTFVLWLSATTIMVVRVLCAPDFKVSIDKWPKKKLNVKKRESKVSRPLDVESKGKLIFINSECPSSRSVRFKRISV